MRFYSFVAQVVSLGDTGPEKLYSYAAWLIRLLPNRQVPADIEITEDMIRLHGHFSRHSPGWSELGFCR
jgi:type I restriction enzyme, R subunit